MSQLRRGPGRRPGRGNRRAGTPGGTLHDLSNHIHGIAMAVELALDEATALPEPHRVKLREIDGRCRQLVELTRELRQRGGLFAEGDAYAVVCTHCGRAILTVSDIGRAEMRAMAEHLHASHPELL
jgi:hypothetical protein